MAAALSTPLVATPTGRQVAIIGGGPAGLMAAEVLSRAGHAVTLFDAKPSVGRKFLLAGKSGMNLTHAEALPQFLQRYGARQVEIGTWLERLSPQGLRDWAQSLGIETFVGSSGRVFPTDMKAAPLLRAWVHRLRQQGVKFQLRHHWLGWPEGAANPHALRFATEQGEVTVSADAAILALGGGSWARLGSDGAWMAHLAACGIPTQPLRPSNCGFDTAWSAHFAERFAGQPVKTVAASVPDSVTPSATHATPKQGEFAITATGVEGSLVYALSAALRNVLDTQGSATLLLDLLPDWSPERVAAEVSKPRGARSLASHLQSRLGLQGVKAGLLRECLSKEAMQDPAQLAQAIKALPLRVVATRPIDEVISTAGGVDFAGLTPDLMLKNAAGVFCVGEMLDWEAPTGGYLLTACFASGVVAAHGVLTLLTNTAPSPT